MWYELPIILAIVGGAIAFFAIRHDDPKKARNCLILGIILTIPLVIGFGFIGSVGGGNPFYIISSGSMHPALEVYDIVIIESNSSFEKTQVDDIILFTRPSGTERVIVARVADIIVENPFTVRTKGDANPASIPGTDFPITEDEYLGKVAYVIPQMGYVTRILQPPIDYTIYLGIILIPIILHIKFRHESGSSAS